MSSSTTDLLLHPVRMRIVNALSSGRPLTTAQLVARMAGFGQATVYRHVARLLQARVIEVEGEERVRGAVERRYRLRPDRARITRKEAAAMSIDEHRRAFTAAMTSLVAEFNAYLDQEGADPYRDGVGYRQFLLWLDRAELERLIDEIARSLLSRAKNAPRAGRVPYRMSPIAFPTDLPANLPAERKPRVITD
jgi:DNA-binding transcriptional ArsR family regulator